jgi:predicted transposase/invertase (TIGR01784 family)
MTTARDTHNQIEYAKETGLEEGLAKGREEGREERNLEVAINLLQLGTPCEIVAKATGLSLEEVAKLKESL